MPVDNHKEPSSESPPSATARRRRRFINRRNAIITASVSLRVSSPLDSESVLAFRLGFIAATSPDNQEHVGDVRRARRNQNLPHFIFATDG